VLCDDVAGAVVVTPSIIEEDVVFCLLNMKASRRHVIIKITAAAVVSLDKNEPAPAPPNTVWLEPPKAAPMSAPLPFCKRTIMIRARHTTICKKIIITCIKGNTS
jgi:hypothetical protein